MPRAPFVKFPHKLTSSPSFYSTSACIASCPQERVSSSAPLSVTRQVLPSAEGCDAPTQAAPKNLRHCPGIGHWTLQPDVQICSSGVHLLLLFNLGRHHAFQRRNDRQQLTSMCLFPWPMFSLRNTTYFRDSAFSQVSVLSPCSLAMALQLFKNLLLKAFHFPLYTVQGSQKAHWCFQLCIV